MIKRLCQLPYQVSFAVAIVVAVAVIDYTNKVNVILIDCRFIGENEDVT